VILGSYMLSWSQLDLNSLRVNCDNSYIHIYMKLNHNSLQWYSHWRFPLGLEIGADFTIFRITQIIQLVHCVLGIRTVVKGYVQWMFARLMNCCECHSNVFDQSLRVCLFVNSLQTEDLNQRESKAPLM